MGVEPTGPRDPVRRPVVGRFLPPGPALRLAALLLAVISVAGVAAGLAGGGLAALSLLMGTAAGGAAAIGARAVPYGVLVAALAGLAGAGAVAAADSPVGLALVVGAAGLAQAPLGHRVGPIGAFLPVLPAILGSSAGAGGSPLVAGVASAAGVLLVIALARVLRLRVPAEAIPSAVAWRHAVVGGLAAAVLTGLSIALSVPHGYWAVATLCAALRPIRGETTHEAQNRVVGTASGALLAVVLALVLPTWAALLAAVPCGILMLAWGVVGSPRRQALYLTPVVVLLGSGGLSEQVLGAALERAAMAVAGTALAVVLALVVHGWDARRTT